MKIHSQTYGEGPELVLLHGWGMNSEIWLGILPDLKKDYRVTLIDLPGYGYSKDVVCEYRTPELIDVLAPVIPKRSILLGWSLGGLIAQLFAIHKPQHIAKLILVASNCQFQQSADWPYAMQPKVLNGFIDNLKKDYRSTLNQFLMLQALGTENAKQTVRELKQRIFSRGEPSHKALDEGLRMLKESSTLHELKNIQCPTLLINGKLDGLVPVKAGEVMQQMMVKAKCEVIDKAGHAPFVSHADMFTNLIREFVTPSWQ